LERLQNKAERDASALTIFMNSEAGKPYLTGGSALAMRWIEGDHYMLIRDGIDWCLVVINQSGVVVLPTNFDLFDDLDVEF
jgi:hypothetical protein